MSVLQTKAFLGPEPGPVSPHPHRTPASEISWEKQTDSKGFYKLKARSDGWTPPGAPRGGVCCCRWCGGARRVPELRGLGSATSWLCDPWYEPGACCVCRGTLMAEGWSRQPVRPCIEDPCPLPVSGLRSPRPSPRRGMGQTGGPPKASPKPGLWSPKPEVGGLFTVRVVCERLSDTCLGAPGGHHLCKPATSCAHRPVRVLSEAVVGKPTVLPASKPNGAGRRGAPGRH